MARSKPRAKQKASIKLILLFLVFAACVVGGYFTCQAICKNDKFEIIGSKTIILTLGESYQDEGAIAIAFGKDISSKIETNDNIDFQTPGSYYIKYTIDNLRYKGVERYRQIIIEEVSDESEDLL